MNFLHTLKNTSWRFSLIVLLIFLEKPPYAQAQNFNFRLGGSSYGGASFGGHTTINLGELTKSSKEKFQKAFWRNDFNTAAKYVKPAFVNDPIHGYPPIYYASIKGNTEVIRMLVRNGASVKYRTQGKSLAYVSAMRGYDSTAEELVQLGGGTKRDISQGIAYRDTSRECERKKAQQATASTGKTDLEKAMGVEFTPFGRQLMQGAKIVPAKYEKCDVCGGTGRAYGGGECFECDGTGYVRLGPIYRALTGQ